MEDSVPEVRCPYATSVFVLYLSEVELVMFPPP